MGEARLHANLLTKLCLFPRKNRQSLIRAHHNLLRVRVMNGFDPVKTNPGSFGEMIALLTLGFWECCVRVEHRTIWLQNVCNRWPIGICLCRLKSWWNWNCLIFTRFCNTLETARVLESITNCTGDYYILGVAVVLSQMCDIKEKFVTSIFTKISSMQYPKCAMHTAYKISYFLWCAIMHDNVIMQLHYITPISRLSDVFCWWYISCCNACFAWVIFAISDTDLK